MEQNDPDAEPDFEEATPQYGTKTVLLVDAEATVRDMDFSALERSWYTVLTASNGDESLKVYTGKKDELALILMDRSSGAIAP